MNIRWGTMAISLLLFLIAAYTFAIGNLALGLTLGSGAAALLYFYQNKLDWKENAMASLLMGVLAFVSLLLLATLINGEFPNYQKSVIKGEAGSGVLEFEEVDATAETLLPIALSIIFSMVVFGQTARWLFGRIKK